MVQRPLGVRAQADQQAAVDEPPHHVTFALPPYVFGLGVPSTPAIRSAAAPPEIGGDGIAARMASASSASTAARDR
ncbi:hypothetical protein ACFRKB_30750 [Streptomyces scopuliridis]|uniref:hypothetical protein n=1 Tax=Streptomyces scopuliridis TaxID=452529 RepID=UPI00369C7396